MKRTYQVVTKPSTLSSRALAEFLSKDGQLLLPLVELVERGEKAIDEVIDVLGRAAVEAVLRMSAEQLAGPKRQGRRVDDCAVYWHGSQHGRVTLSERQLRVEKPRLRKKTAKQGERGEVAIPSYDAMQHDQRLADRMLAIMLNGGSTRRYAKVLPAMAEQVGISKSEVSRETIAAGTRVLQDLAERDFSEVDMVIIYLAGIQFGHYHVLAAVGVDDAGRKHVLGVRSGASENATVTTALLEDLVARGIRPDRRRLFVLDGAKALRNAIAQVFARATRCSAVATTSCGMSSATCRTRSTTTRGLPCAPAWKLEATAGMRKLEQDASWLQRDWPAAAASVREGLEEIFTVNRLGLPASLRRCLTTTNIIDSTHSGIRQRTRRVTNWKNGEMALRWAAVAFVETEKHYRRVTGYEHLWMLKAHLDHDDDNVAEMQKVG